MRLLGLLLVFGLLGAACSEGNTGPGFLLEAGDPIWIPTQPDAVVAMEALGTFDLRFDRDLNCIYHDEEDNNGEPGTGGRILVIWPDGYRAERTPDGASIVDERGEIVATTNSPFQLAGGAIDASDDHCGAIGAWLANGGPIRD